MTWDNDFALSILPALLRGLWITVQVTMLSIAIALVLGLIIAVPRYLKVPVLSQVLDFVVLFIRGTPLMVQAFFAFFVLPEYGITLSAFATGVIVLGVNYSAYTAEVYRAGIEDVPKGQWEATVALSLPGSRTWTRIILPQAMRSIVPMLGNYWIQMFKDSAILSVITVSELLYEGQKMAGSDYRYLEPLTLVGLLFLAVSIPAAFLIRRLEKRLAFTR